jgi:Mg2+ and Co2+ transporter CorA
MKINQYLISSGKLLAQPVPAGWPSKGASLLGEQWSDVQDAEPEELRQYLAPLDLHPLMLDRCLVPATAPAVLSDDRTVLVQFPVASNQESDQAIYLTLFLQASVLVTIRHEPMPALDDLIHNLVSDQAGSLRHIPQLVYLIIDQLADLNVQREIFVRDQIQRLAKTLAEDPAAVGADDLTRLRAQVDNLISLIENHLYCVAGLNASDNAVLQEPHRKAYIQDLVSEAEIAQKGIYRLESRVDDLYAFYQAASSDRVEKRLRFLTIVSVITLPLGLIAGLLGMNVGGVPGTTDSSGFLIVVGVMISLTLIEFLFFKWNGWFS